MRVKSKGNLVSATLSQLVGSHRWFATTWIACDAPISDVQNFNYYYYYYYYYYYFATDQLCRDREISIATEQHGWYVVAEPLCRNSPLSSARLPALDFACPTLSWPTLVVTPRLLSQQKATIPCCDREFSVAAETPSPPRKTV